MPLWNDQHVIKTAKEENIPDTAIKFGKDLAIGAVAAIIAKTIVAPIERVKLVLQLQNAQERISVTKRYRGMMDCFIRLPREEGFFSFWRGNLVNIARACSQESLGFAFKDFFKIWSLSGVSNDSYWKFFTGNIAAGGASGISTYCVIYPLDFVRTRLAVDMGKGVNREFRGFFDCLKKIIKHEGVRGLYYGFGPSIQYIFIYRGAYYGLFDSAKVFAPSNEKKQISFLSAFIIGQFVTFIAAFISYPWDTIRRRLMMQAGRNDILYRGFIHCAKKIYYEEGFRAFFSGMLPNAVRGSGAALVLAFYNEFSKYI
ncbi:unnamed protein product [Dracunculus medinensis]|uniref:ADP/ATP translocase n=1 Tax=Dracunculus medinensis TaxID=318479 RepID=A0A0N4UHW8_DRAME|nr:unnamed protein product [Dracunculus medinensis]